jgi:dimethylargininase
MNLSAVTREPASTLPECQLTHLTRQAIDVELARRQHAAYRDALRALGVEVIHLPARDEWPDSVFVEDAAVVLDEVAVITRPGAPSRVNESAALAETLNGFRRLHVVVPPATLDGGDVLRVGKTLYTGRSERTNEEGIRQLHGIVQPFGYEVVPVAISGCLHLKTACSVVGPELVLADVERADTAALRDVRILVAPPDERAGVDALAIAGVVMLAAGYPQIAALLEGAGCNILELELSEFGKAEGGPTCLSIVFSTAITNEFPATRQSRR